MVIRPGFSKGLDGVFARFFRVQTGFGRANGINPPVLERLDPSDVTAARLLARRKEAHLADRVRWADRLCRLDVVG